MTRLDADWLTAPDSQAIMAMLTDAGHQAWFVGGCVRNGLIGAPVSDIDISTDARPDRVIELATEAGFHPVPTGIDHGTVTVVVHGTPFEITTFRKDVQTDGRRAVVAFAETMEEDAHRRDFTMNALYAAPDGTVTDPLGGLPDLVARLVRFIDDPEARIREDYLRILRFFRFHAWYGDPDGGLEPEGLAACAALADGIETLSRERMGQEMRKLLAAPAPERAVAAMQAAGVLMRVLPGADARAVPVLVDLEAGRAPDPIRRLACLGGTDVADRLRLSRADARRLQAIGEAAASGDDPAVLAYRRGADIARDAILVRHGWSTTPLPADMEPALARGAAAVFPLRAADLPDLEGAALGARLKELESRWIASDFTLGKEALLRG